jgi:PAS domain S-box-containing protein
VSQHDDRIASIERQLAAAQAITHMGSWDWDMRTNVVRWSDELYRIYGFEPQSRPITFEFFVSRLHPDDRAHTTSEVRKALERGGRFAYQERIVRPDGSVRVLDTIGEVAFDADGRPRSLLGTCRDVTEERARDEAIARARRLHEAEHRVLGLIATSVPLRQTLDCIVLAIEDLAPPTMASIVLLDPDGVHLRHASAPHLPEAYTRRVDGEAIGPRAGSCGTAAYEKRQVIAEDIETDPLWVDYRDLALAHGLRACWSTPVFHADGRVLGTFALYYRQPRSPSAEERDLISRATHLAGIAITRTQLEEQLRALTARTEEVREEERTGIAREIHDELGQALTAFKMDLSWLARRISGESMAPGITLLEKLAAMSEMVDDVIGRVRRISSELRPGVLDDLGLLAAIEWEAQRFEERARVESVVTSNVGDRQFPRDLSTAIFRIAQEALTNVARHARATHVTIRLDSVDSVSNVTGKRALRLEVRDDGVGISDEAVRSPRALGLLGMRERARGFGGTFSSDRGPEGGTVVRVEVPLDAGGKEGA